jgi:histone acetyltransferase (RNA polymerase elongator complex component)
MKPLIVPFFISHRGCSHRCVFCDQTTISGSVGDVPAPEEILAKIDAYRNTAVGRPVEAAFYGGTFTALPLPLQQRLLQPLQPLIAAGTLQAVRVSTRPDTVDPGIIHFRPLNWEPSRWMTGCLNVPVVGMTAPPQSLPAAPSRLRAWL